MTGDGSQAQDRHTPLRCASLKLVSSELKVCGNVALSDDGEHFLAVKYLLRYVHCFLRHNTIAHLIDIVKYIHNFICTGKSKNW